MFWPFVHKQTHFSSLKTGLFGKHHPGWRFPETSRKSSGKTEFLACNHQFATLSIFFMRQLMKRSLLAIHWKLSPPSLMHRLSTVNRTNTNFFPGFWLAKKALRCGLYDDSTYQRAFAFSSGQRIFFENSPCVEEKFFFFVQRRKISVLGDPYSIWYYRCFNIRSTSTCKKHTCIHMYVWNRWRCWVIVRAEYKLLWLSQSMQSVKYLATKVLEDMYWST